jgi:Cu-processing system permease protein
LLVVLGSVAATAVFLAIAALLSAGTSGRRRARTLALALVVWFAAVAIFDVAALGVASLLPSGAASRVLIVGVIVNPVDALRTGVLLGIQGTAAFGAASLAFLRFTKGSLGAGLALGASVLSWVVIPLAVAVFRIRRADV